MKNISFILPVHLESERNLSECLYSISKFLLPTDELIIILSEESNDNIKFCKKYANNKQNIIIYIYGDETKPAGRKNFGVQKAKYDIISYIHVDLYYPAKADLAREYIPEYDMIFTSYESDNKGELKYKRAGKITPRIHTPTVSEKKEIALKYPFPEKSAYWDCYIDKYAKMIDSNVRILSIDTATTLSIRNFGPTKKYVTSLALTSLRNNGFDERGNKI